MGEFLIDPGDFAELRLDTGDGDLGDLGDLGDIGDFGELGLDSLWRSSGDLGE